MSNGLSQEEINALLQANINTEETPKKSKRGRKKASTKNDISEGVQISETTEPDNGERKETIDISELEKDIIGEIGNISMGSASTALSDMIGKRVNITTPVISITTLKKMRENFEVPNIALEIKYITGIVGKNILIMKITDAAVIANLMMGGTGEVNSQTLSEIEESAVSEAMNQMIGSAATSMATMFARKVDISPPKSKIWDSTTANMAEGIEEEEEIIQVAFKLQIENLIDSFIMQVLSVETVKKITSIMMGTEKAEEPADDPKPDDIVVESKQEAVEKIKAQALVQEEPEASEIVEQNAQNHNLPNEPSENKMQRVEYKSFGESSHVSKNTSSLFDVPLNIQVVLGSAQRTIKEIMNFGSGTLLELNQVAEQPVELQVNGKVIAYGEVVIVDGNLAINILDVNKEDM